MGLSRLGRLQRTGAGLSETLNPISVEVHQGLAYTANRAVPGSTPVQAPCVVSGHANGAPAPAFSRLQEEAIWLPVGSGAARQCDALHRVYLSSVLRSVLAPTYRDGYLGVQSRPGNVTLDIELTFAAGSPATLYSNMLPEIANITLVTRHCVFGEVSADALIGCGAWG